jgi:hypothetical protein
VKKVGCTVNEERYRELYWEETKVYWEVRKIIWEQNLNPRMTIKRGMEGVDHKVCMGSLSESFF